MPFRVYNTVQALASQGVIIALGYAFTTYPANQLIVSPQFCGSNLKESNQIPVVTSPTEMLLFNFYSLIVEQRTKSVKKNLCKGSVTVYLVMLKV